MPVIEGCPYYRELHNREVTILQVSIIERCHTTEVFVIQRCAYYRGAHIKDVCNRKVFILQVSVIERCAYYRGSVIERCGCYRVVRNRVVWILQRCTFNRGVHITDVCNRGVHIIELSVIKRCSRYRRLKQRCAYYRGVRNREVCILQRCS